MENITPEVRVPQEPNAVFRKMMEVNFLEYASSVIKDRAIPDVDDGLKPVQRRILWSLHRIDDGKFNKVANVIGDTMKFHPHGDASIGDALVVLANKEFFLEKQGNFGNITTGDNASAPRYIECRLSELAKVSLYNDDITVLMDSYDGRNQEPVVLPVKLPALLMMGVEGIAVGASTKILPHNFIELLEAQVKILRKEKFNLLPDFKQGGLMDASKYADGMGRITLRAKIETDGRKLIIREIPAFTDTAQLIESIEKAGREDKIKIATINDFTADKVEIEIIPQRGADTEQLRQALFAYTKCQVTATLNPLVIVDNKPKQMTVSDILHRNTEKLTSYLRAELNIESYKTLDKLFNKTLAQIFIGEGVYKRMEKCKEDPEKEVRLGLEEHRSKWEGLLERLKQNLAKSNFSTKDETIRKRVEQINAGKIPDGEIIRLLDIPIRRISPFDLGNNAAEMTKLEQQFNETQKNLDKLNTFTIKFLNNLIVQYKDQFPRNTKIISSGFEKIEKSDIALNNIKVFYDSKTGYVGTSIKSEESLLCNEFDHILCISKDGRYKIIDIAEKVFTDKLEEFQKHDKELEWALIYTDLSSGKSYYKRFVIDRFIKDKEYRLCPQGCKIEVLEKRTNLLYECKTESKKASKKNMVISLQDAPIRKSTASGVLLCPFKAKFTRSKVVNLLNNPKS